MARIAGTQYSIGSATRRCAATDRELGTGDRFVAALVQRPEEEAFERLDFSEQAWVGGARPARGLTLYGFWRGVVQEPGAKKRLLIDDQSLLELFEQSEDDLGGDAATGDQAAPTVAERLAFRFVLALILLRKRLLVQEGSKGRNMLVRARGVAKPPEGPALIEVVDPGLDDRSVAKVTGMLGAVISGEPAESGQAARKEGGA